MISPMLYSTFERERTDAGGRRMKSIPGPLTPNYIEPFPIISLYKPFQFSSERSTIIFRSICLHSDEF